MKRWRWGFSVSLTALSTMIVVAFLVWYGVTTVGRAMLSAEPVDELFRFINSAMWGYLVTSLLQEWRSKEPS